MLLTSLELWLLCVPSDQLVQHPCLLCHDNDWLVDYSTKFNLFPRSHGNLSCIIQKYMTKFCVYLIYCLEFLRINKRRI